ncbi:LysR family transcriptional regulator [Halotalea alkalilenta]|uniref:LysR family transcriptional regulator n=1 Tax=Halotalea alkalilenta TaxID=376489 RepID=UPI00069380F8|nr:LysR family transcriptional regulator [Halotalea alkalilenta]
MAHATLKQLRYFVVAGELKSVTRAAERLHVSQPSISAAIAHIESIAGVALFVRHHAQGLSLTAAGTQLLARARALLQDADGVLQFAVSLGEEIAGPLRMAAFPTFAPVIVPGLMHDFLERYPRVSPQCDEGHQVEIIDGLHRGTYELAFAYDLAVPDDLRFTPLYLHHPYAVVGLDHPLACREQVSLGELAEHDMVLLDWPLSRDYFLGLFSAEGCTPRVAHRATSLGMARGLVAHGFGFSLFNVPLGSDVAFDGRRLRAVPLVEAARPLRIGIATLDGIRLAPAAEAMRRFALERAERSGMANGISGLD